MLDNIQRVAGARNRKWMLKNEPRASCVSGLVCGVAVSVD